MRSPVESSMSSSRTFGAGETSCASIEQRVRRLAHRRDGADDERAALLRRHEPPRDVLDLLRRRQPRSRRTSSPHVFRSPTTLIPTLSRHCHNHAVRSDARLEPGGLAGADVVVEDGAPEAAVLSSLLEAEGARAPERERRTSSTPTRARMRHSWTRGRRRWRHGSRDCARNGALVTCLGDLVLARAGDRAVGITGTAGKTTTTSFAIQLLRAAGVDVAASEPGVSGTCGPTRAPSESSRVLSARARADELPPRVLPRLAARGRRHLVLAGPHRVARVARGVRAREGGDSSATRVAIPTSSSSRRTARASASSPSRRRRRCASRRPSRSSAARACWRGGWSRALGRLGARALASWSACRLRGRLVTAALAAGRDGARRRRGARGARRGVATLHAPPHRVVEVAWHAGVPVVDASMAGTPTKAEAALEPYEDGSVVLVAGGDVEGAAGPVHASPEERELLERAVCPRAAQGARRSCCSGRRRTCSTGSFPTRTTRPNWQAHSGAPSHSPPAPRRSSWRRCSRSGRRSVRASPSLRAGPARRRRRIGTWHRTRRIARRRRPHPRPSVGAAASRPEPVPTISPRSRRPGTRAGPRRASPRLGVHVHHVARLVVGHPHVLAQRRVEAEVTEGVLGRKVRRGEVVVAVRHEDAHERVAGHRLAQGL